MTLATLATSTTNTENMLSNAYGAMFYEALHQAEQGEYRLLIPVYKQHGSKLSAKVYRNVPGDAEDLVNIASYASTIIARSKQYYSIDTALGPDSLGKDRSVIKALLNQGDQLAGVFVVTNAGVIYLHVLGVRAVWGQDYKIALKVLHEERFKRFKITPLAPLGV